MFRKPSTAFTRLRRLANLASTLARALSALSRPLSTRAHPPSTLARPMLLLARPMLLFAALVLFLPACKKDSGASNVNGGNGGGYYMRFKLNGTSVEYDSQPFGGISYNKADSVYTLVIAAYKDVNAGLKNAVTITIFSNSSIAAGAAFNDPLKARVNGTISPANTIFYYDSTANGFLTLGLLADNNGNIPIPGVVADAHLTISELTSTYLKGTFSGTVYKSSGFTQYQSITQGQFYLKRSQ